MHRTMVLAAALLLAGCSDPAPTDTTATQDMPDGQALGQVANVTAAAPTFEEVPLSLSGTLGTGLHGCVFPAGVCETRDVAPGTSEIVLERPGTNLTSVDLTITWTAQSPFTAELDVGVMIMTSCEGCEDDEFAFVSGPSPITISASDLDYGLNESTVLHIYVYNPKSLVYDPNVPAYGVVSVDQPFRIEGTATLRVPAD